MDVRQISIFLYKNIKKIFFNLIGPGGNGCLARCIDHKAARRILQSMISKTNNFDNVRWLGKPVWQFPLGIWVLQEMIAEVKPDIIIETGTHFGGSAYFFACLCDLLNHGGVISIDIAPQATIPHPRIKYIKGSSVDPRTLESVKKNLGHVGIKKILVILDSDHSAYHVKQELETYAPLIPIGSYIHIQDGCIDDLFVLKKDRPGPKVATRAFLKSHPEFIRDSELESRYLITFHPYGWIKRIS